MSASGSELGLELPTILLALDSMDPNEFAKIISDDSRLKFADYPQSVGKQQIRAAQVQFYGGINSMSHRLLKSWQDEWSIVAQMEVTYGRHDGTTITLPVVDVFEIRDQQLAATLVYIDLAPLYQQ